jgi:ketosteroid isomerase-like protein
MSNLKQIQELYGAFGRGDIEPVLAALAPDVEWVEGDVEGLPYRGAHHGPEAVGRDVFAQIPGAYESFELAPQEWVDGKITRFESFQDTLATARVLGTVGSAT